MRIAGLGGTILAKLGVVPQQIAGGDIYPALEHGTIDAAEWVGPYDDEKLGFQQASPSTTTIPACGRARQCQLHREPGEVERAARFVQGDRGSGLRRGQRALRRRNTTHGNPDALLRLVASGAELRPFPQDVMVAAFKEAQALYGELAASNPAFKTFYDSWLPYWRKEQLWFRVAELPFDAFNAGMAQQMR